jgi:hypothetical protein
MLVRLTVYQASSPAADLRPPMEFEVCRRQSEERSKILDFYFLCRYLLADTLQIVKMLD